MLGVVDRYFLVVKRPDPYVPRHPYRYGALVLALAIDLSKTLFVARITLAPYESRRIPCRRDGSYFELSWSYLLARRMAGTSRVVV